MSFFGFGSKTTTNAAKTANRDQSQRKSFIEDHLLPRRYLSCIKFCYQNFGNPLSKEEKVCLAQCADNNFERFNSNYQALYALSNSGNTF